MVRISVRRRQRIEVGRGGSKVEVAVAGAENQARLHIPTARRVHVDGLRFRLRFRGFGLGVFEKEEGRLLKLCIHHVLVLVLGEQCGC